MIYTKLTCKAIKMAYSAHRFQVDKAGIPYILHPYHVAEQMTDEASTCVALLHDVVEDTGITLSELRKEFPQEIVDAVEALTHIPGTGYSEYIYSVAKNPIATRVKIEDLYHNLDSTRFAGLSLVEMEGQERRKVRYKKALEYLLEVKNIYSKAEETR